jgi:phosphatidate phosphatase APP1
MTDFRRLVQRMGERLETTAARSPSVLREPPRIEAYHGYANATEAFVSGRILANAALGEAGEADPWWRNLLNTYRRMESDETPGMRLRIDLGDSRAESVSDEEGHFRARIPLAAPLRTDRRWHDAAIRLVPPHGVAWPEVNASASVLLPAPTAGFAVISDVDDTVIKTNATRPIRMMRTVLFENARTRRPFPGVPAFYARLERGSATGGPNPFFYLSSSPWNLHDVLVDFMEHNRIPVGPLLLKDWGLPERGLARTTHREHKLARIEHLLAVYPELPFVLIGDNGQADPAIYAETAVQHKERVLAVYIREVADDERRKRALDRCAENLAAEGIAFLAFRDTDEARGHAATRGLIE